jgi:progressive ankylosis protein
LVALQNALQGFLVSERRTWVINQATWVGSILMLAVAYLGVNGGQPGAIAAAMGMSIGSISEIIYLACCWRWQQQK